jgi:hypothetical protein
MKTIKNVEQILDDIITFLKADLNCVITRINSEYSDGITLLTLGDDAYFIELAEIPEEKVFINIVLDDSLTLDPNNHSRAAISLNVVISIWFSLSDAGNNNPDYRKGLRYMDALYRVCQNRNSFNFGYEMTTLLPVRRDSLNGVQKMGTGIQLSYKFS